MVMVASTRAPAPSRAGVEQRHVEEAQEGAEGGRLGGHGHEGGDRRRGALVDVGRPLVEGRHRGLEARPTTLRAMPVSSSGIARDVARRLAMPEKSVEPVAP
jgi:hypothetical protein